MSYGVSLAFDNGTFLYLMVLIYTTGRLIYIAYAIELQISFWKGLFVTFFFPYSLWKLRCVECARD